jgi:uncharacterized protein (UPF0254 family)
MRLPVLKEPDVPLCPLESVQAVALVEVQEMVVPVLYASVVAIAERIAVGAGVTTPVGAGATLILSDCATDPPAPVQEIEYPVVRVRLPVLKEPDVPPCPEESVQAVALVEVQLMVVELLYPMLLEAVVRETVGAGVATGAGVGLGAGVLPPPPPPPPPELPPPIGVGSGVTTGCVY